MVMDMLTMAPPPTEAANSLENLGVGDAGILALLGYAVVFFGLILLMVVVFALGSVFAAKAKKALSRRKAPFPYSLYAISKRLRMAL